MIKPGIKTAVMGNCPTDGKRVSLLVGMPMSMPLKNMISVTMRLTGLVGMCSAQASEVL